MVVSRHSGVEWVKVKRVMLVDLHLFSNVGGETIW